ncbi:MAG: glycerol kinase GlpK [Rhodospirillaceae bacterium]|nr:glycerol kinase GlpK [Rhodospirillaceae bacterium]
MTQATRILAIDQGTTSTRAVMFDAAGHALASEQIPLRQIYPRDGWVEHDADEIWLAATKVCRAVIERTGGIGRGDMGSVAAIGITNQRETAVIWDRATGRPIHNAIVWQDRRGAAACEALRAAGHEPLVQARTGLVPDSYFSATKATWLLDNVAGARDAAAAGRLAFGTIDSWLLWNLTGGKVHATDATNASRTMLVDIATGRWDDALLDLFRVPRAVLPEIRDTAGVFGATDAQLFGRAVPVAALVGDQQSALVGQAGFREGMIKSTYGTGCFVLVNTGARQLASTHKLLTTVAYQLNGQRTYALEGSIFNAGTAIQWLRDNLRLVGHAGETEALVRAIEDAPPRVHFVPAFTGLGAPYWDSEARGAILGLTRDTSAAEIVRAALEAVCFQTNDLLDTFRRDGMPPPGVLRVDGGMVANAWLVQALADITGVPVERPAMTETTVLGAAFLAGLGVGVFADLAGVESAWRRDLRTEPRLDPARRSSRIDGWSAAVARVRGRT